ncbi:MAG: amidohydrolase [Saprospiraceae bacterium]
MKVALVQSDLVWEDKMANLTHFEEVIRGITEKVDIIVLPEMFTTGFSMNVAQLAEPTVASTMLHLVSWAEHADAAICASFIAEEEGKYYNRLIWVQPDGEYCHYDKKHLFGLADEPKHYTAGTERLIIEWRGWRICPLICYDVRFPIWSRNNNAYDLLIYIANFPTRRIHAWNSLLIARAIENQSYTIGVNRVGTDGKGIDYSGESCVIDFEGNTIIRESADAAVLIAEMDIDQQSSFRRSLPFLRDQDAFVLK